MAMNPSSGRALDIPMASAMDGLPAMASRNCWASAPIMPAMISAPASQPRAAGMWIEVARPMGLRSHADARADPAPPRKRELPRSRRAAMTTASVPSNTPKAMGIRRVHHRMSPKAAAFSAQPSGESHVIHVLVTSPTPRST